MSSSIGNMLKVSVFGQSHSGAIGVNIENLPVGFKIDMQKLSAFLQRRAPGTSELSTARKEADEPNFLCGLVDDTTCGAPLTAVIYNKDTRSSDYNNIKDIPRPSHADYAAQIKYKGFQDVAGGGHFSGRLTAPLCIAGGICKQILEEKGVYVNAHIKSIGAEQDVNITEENMNSVNTVGFPVIDDAAGERMKTLILQAKSEADSIGGTIECIITGVPAGLGSPMFGGMENKIAALAFGVPAVKGIEFGNGFEAARIRGSQNNDPFCVRDGKIVTETNNHGGILGGITSGMPVVFTVAVKPTPSIGMEQDSVSISENENKKLIIKGRHDPCIVPRAVPCIEAIAAIAVLDAYMEEKGVNL